MARDADIMVDVFCAGAVRAMMFLGGKPFETPQKVKFEARWTILHNSILIRCNGSAAKSDSNLGFHHLRHFAK